MKDTKNQQEKNFPGEKEGKLDEFKAQSSSPAADGGSHASLYEPVALNNFNFIHLAMVGLGICIFIAGYLIFIFGHQPDKVLFEMSNAKRLMIAVLITLVAAAVIILGAAQRKNLAITAAVILGVGMLYLPFHFKDAYKYERYVLPLEKKKAELLQEQQKKASTPIDKLSSGAQLKLAVNYEEYSKFKEQHADKQTKIYLIDSVKNAHITAVTDFLEESLSHRTTFQIFKSPILIKERASLCLYIAAKEDDLLNVENSIYSLSNKIDTTELDEVFQASLASGIAGQFPTKESIDSLSIVPKTKTYALYLINISPTVQRRCLEYFKETETLAYAPEVLERFRVLFKVRDERFKEHVTEALHHWRELIDSYPGKLVQIDPYIDRANASLVEQMHETIEQDLDIPDKILKYLAEFQVTGSEKILFYAWSNNPLSSQRSLRTAGALSEFALLPHLTSLDEIQLISACKILSQNGSKQSLAPLQKLKTKATSEKIKTSLQSTIDEIKKRL